MEDKVVQTERCRRCNSAKHEARNCKTRWFKCWPGHPVMLIGIATKDGAVIELEVPMTEEFAEKALAFQLEAIKTLGGEKGALHDKLTSAAHAET